MIFWCSANWDFWTMTSYNWKSHQGKDIAFKKLKRWPRFQTICFCILQTWVFTSSSCMGKLENSLSEIFSFIFQGSFRIWNSHLSSSRSWLCHNARGLAVWHQVLPQTLINFSPDLKFLNSSGKLLQCYIKQVHHPFHSTDSDRHFN